MQALCAQLPAPEPARAPSGLRCHARISTSAMRSHATASHASCLTVRWAAVFAGPQLARQVPKGSSSLHLSGGETVAFTPAVALYTVYTIISRCSRSVYMEKLNHGITMGDWWANSGPTVGFPSAVGPPWD
ncbi:hypothetical protein Y032_0180g800 [Ancylostoma ceylanicum]|uniref:Uncharacterized protein n=1 Tax=Ancylostoma ceylanicum TaxID=53326 RepID=A0A016STE3_9BILA|nr:hypothetical protein Y032_0180g800 [Ancylostoma ceylanicum]